MKVKFLPQNVEFEIGNGESVLDVARKNNIFIKSVCGGIPSCSECRVKVVGGGHNIMPPTFKEKALIGSAYFIDQSRLSCQLKCMGDVTVDLTEQIEKEKVLGESGKKLVAFKPASSNPDPDLQFKKKN